MTHGLANFKDIIKLNAFLFHNQNEFLTLTVDNVFMNFL